MKNFTDNWFVDEIVPMEKEQTIVPSEYYDEAYFTQAGEKGWYDRGAFDLSNEFHKRWAEFCIKILDIPKGARVLDVGCAIGNVVHWMHKMGMNAWGFDVSLWAIKHSHEPKRVWAADAGKFWKYPSNEYDYAVCREMLEHISKFDVPTVFAEFKRCMKVGGKALVTFANNRADKEIKKQVGLEADPSHVTIAPLYWWAKQIQSIEGLVVDWERTAFATAQPVCQLYDWDMIVFERR